jgi:hypothetical protein
MRQLYEPLLIQYSADIVFNGHVHAYGRSKPVNNYTVGLSQLQAVGNLLQNVFMQMRACPRYDIIIHATSHTEK